MMKQIALLPLKANSERIPGKNFRNLCGKPLFRWMLDCLLSIDSVETVVINTDAREILNRHGLTKSPRVLIRDRPQSLCGDLVSMNRIIEDDISAVAADMYLMTHTTNPLLSANSIRQAIGQYCAQRQIYDSLFSVNRIHARFYRADGSAVNHDSKTLMRTQDLEPWFEENSCLYIFDAHSFSLTGARIGEKPLMYELPRLESVDIDDFDDWRMAEALLEYAAKH